MADVQFAELISKIAHELRSPLTSVVGFSSTLVKRWDKFTDEQRLQFVETIHQDAQRMGRVISEVVDLARLEAGRLELELTHVDLTSLVQRTLDNVAGLSGIERVSSEIGDGLTLRGDAARLERVLTNLLENALKFSDEGPIEVRAKRASSDEVELSVRDRGVGVATDRLPFVFDGPADSTTRSSPSGSGLGLYLSRRLVEAHGGRVVAESTEGEGSTFRVLLPGGGS